MQVSDPNLTAGRERRKAEGGAPAAPSAEFQNASHLSRSKLAREVERQRQRASPKATTGEVRGDGCGKARVAHRARVWGAIALSPGDNVVRPSGPSAALAIRPSIGEDGRRAT